MMVNNLADESGHLEKYLGSLLILNRIFFRLKYPINFSINSGMFPLIAGIPERLCCPVCWKCLVSWAIISWCTKQHWNFWWRKWNFRGKGEHVLAHHKRLLSRRQWKVQCAIYCNMSEHGMNGQGMYHLCNLYVNFSSFGSLVYSLVVQLDPLLVILF